MFVTREPMKLNTERDDIFEFKDGLTYVNGFNGADREYNDMIIDLNGSVTFEAQDENLMILGYGGGKFLVAQHVSGMTQNEWQIGAIDKNGNTVVPFKTYENYSIGNITFDGPDPIESCKYIGDGIFQFRKNGDDMNEYNINTETQTMISNEIELLTDFVGGYATAYSNGILYKLGADGTLSEIQNNWDSVGFYSLSEFNEGLAIRDGQYYDLLGNLVIDFPKYRESGLSYECHPFNKSGYAPLTIFGADGNDYVTMIDKSGNETFEPMQTTNSDIIPTDDGYLIADILDEQGFYSSHVVLNTAGELIMRFDTAYPPTLLGTNISDGMLRVGGIYINMQDGSVIGKYNEIAYSFELLRPIEDNASEDRMIESETLPSDPATTDGNSTGELTVDEAQEMVESWLATHQFTEHMLLPESDRTFGGEDYYHFDLRFNGPNVAPHITSICVNKATGELISYDWGNETHEPLEDWYADAYGAQESSNDLQESYSNTMLVNTGGPYLNMREGPGTDYELNGKIPDGTILEVTKTMDSWGAVSYEGSYGWVSLEFLEPIQ